ncbi:sulfotransferase family protein [Rhabdochromatium marinum]|uniref:sulfotransferase family protein n=1 Tax=Rhabdochromatium marinum TaxID=48729 RepID=UPI001903FE68|nr:sulfotransferase [Rhabdochromatium marinum]
MAFPSPLFLLTTPHSFGSRLAAMLGQHAAVYAPAELNLLAADRVVDLFDALPAQGTQGLLRTIAQLYGGEQTLESIDMARRWLYRRAHMTTSEVLAELCAQVAPRRLVVYGEAYSAPTWAARLTQLRHAFPQGRFLHLTRHPWDQCRTWFSDPDGLARLYLADALDKTGLNPVPDPQIDWYRRHRGILDFLHGVPDELQYQLRVEDLLGDARLALARLCAWLGLAWSQAQFEAMCRPEQSPYAGVGPYGAEGGMDAEFLKDPAQPLSPPAPAPLEQPLPWRTDGGRLTPETIALAQLFGYG